MMSIYVTTDSRTRNSLVKYCEADYSRYADSWWANYYVEGGNRTQSYGNISIIYNNTKTTITITGLDSRDDFAYLTYYIIRNFFGHPNEKIELTVSELTPNMLEDIIAYKNI